MTPIQARWCYEGCQFTPEVAFFGEGNLNRVTVEDPGMVGMFMLLPMWRGCFMWWDGSQCATGPRSVCQLLQQLLLILWGQLLVRERRRDASITSSLLKFINLWHFSCPSDITTLLEEKSPNQTRLFSNKQLPPPQLPDIAVLIWGQDNLVWV